MDELPNVVDEIGQFFVKYQPKKSDRLSAPGRVNMTASSEVYDNSSNPPREPEVFNNYHAPLERMQTDNDDPKDYDKFYDENRPTVNNVSVVQKEGEEMMARRKQGNPAAPTLDGGAGADDKEKVTNVLGPNETTEDVLCRTSAIWRERFESARLYERNVAGLVVGTAEYEKAYNSHRISRLKHCWDVISNTTDPLLPSSVKQSRKWFDRLTAVEQFPLVPTVYSNLTYFGNIIAHTANDFTVIANPGQNFETMFCIRVTCLGAPHFNPNQSLMALLSGDASVGKSYLMHCNKLMLPDGWAIVMSHLSTLGLSSDENDDFIVLMIEETPMTMTQETDAKTGADNGASFLKTLLTNKIVTTRTVAYDKGERTRKVHVTSKMMTGVFATNGTLQSNSPLLKRYMVIKPGFDPEIAEKIAKIKAADFEAEHKNALLRQRVIAHYVQMTELMIGMGAIKGPDMDEFAIYMAKIVTEMKGHGHFMVDAKAVNMVQAVVRTLVVMRAVCEALLSEKNVSLRVDLESGAHRMFETHYIEHFTNIEKLLVAQEPEVVFGISMCAHIFGDDTIGKMVDAARHILQVEVVDEPHDPENTSKLEKENKFCKLGRHLAFMPKVEQIAAGEKKLTFDYNYPEIQPPQGRGTENVVDLLCSRSLERPSNNNMSQAVLKASRMNLTHSPMNFREVNGNEFGEVYFDKKKKPIDNTLLKRIQMEDDFEEVVSNPVDPNKNARRTASQKSYRYFFNLAALMHFVPQREAMKKSIEKLQHIGTYEARHLICMPHVQPYTNRPGSKLHNFHGIFDYIEFKRTNNVLFFHSQHTLLASQLETLSSSMMFDGGDPKLMLLTKTQLEERERANKKRSIMAQTSHTAVSSNLDYDLFMMRHLVCAAVGEDNDMTFWHNFVSFMLAKRKSMPGNFGPYITYLYPEDVVRQAQTRNKNNVLVANEKISPVEKMRALSSFSSIVYGNAAALEPPSIFEIHKRLKNGGVEGLRNSFPRIDPALYKPLYLHKHSEQHATSTDWTVLRNIFTLYRNPEKLMRTYSFYCGLDFRFAEPNEVGEHQKHLKIVKLTEIEAPDPSTIVEKTAQERLTKKRLNEEIDPTFKKQRNSATQTTNIGESSEYDKQVDDYNRMIEQDKALTHRRLAVETYDQGKTIDNLLDESEKPTTNSDKTPTNNATSTKQPQIYFNSRR